MLRNFISVSYILTFFGQLKFNIFAKSNICINKSADVTASSGNIFKWMIGVFDNHDQIADEVKLQNISHDYVTANFSIHPFYNDTIIVSYYYDGNTSNVFRFRFYTFEKMKRKFGNLWKIRNRDSYLMKM